MPLYGLTGTRERSDRVAVLLIDGQRAQVRGIGLGRIRGQLLDALLLRRRELRLQRGGDLRRDVRLDRTRCCCKMASTSACKGANSSY